MGLRRNEILFGLVSDSFGTVLDSIGFIRIELQKDSRIEKDSEG